MYWMFLLLLTFWAEANDSYYGREFHQVLRDSSSTSKEIKQSLFKVLDSYHIDTGAFDEITSVCRKGRVCYRQLRTSYKQARKVLFGKIHLKKGSKIFDVYCDRNVRDASIGKGKIPNHRILNTEHTWPQSRFSKGFAKGLQKSDLHALYPVNPRVNSQRSNLMFGEVNRGGSSICAASTRGKSNRFAGTFFEPPDSHKGNVARAIFYFSVRYKMPVDERQEAFLREWHKLDPVDQFEIQRNDQIFDSQKNRNPFVDFPDIVKRIKDF